MTSKRQYYVFLAKSGSSDEMLKNFLGASNVPVQPKAGSFKAI